MGRRGCTSSIHGSAGGDAGADALSWLSPIAKALLRGFILYPEALHDHVEELAHLTIADRGCALLRDQLTRYVSGRPLRNLVKSG